MASSQTWEEPSDMASSQTSEEPPDMASSQTSEEPPDMGSSQTWEELPDMASSKTWEELPNMTSSTTSKRPLECDDYRNDASALLDCMSYYLTISGQAPDGTYYAIPSVTEQRVCGMVPKCKSTINDIVKEYELTDKEFKDITGRMLSFTCCPLNFGGRSGRASCCPELFVSEPVASIELLLLALERALAPVWFGAFTAIAVATYVILRSMDKVKKPLSWKSAIPGLLICSPAVFGVYAYEALTTMSIEVVDRQEKTEVVDRQEKTEVVDRQERIEVVDRHKKWRIRTWAVAGTLMSFAVAAPDLVYRIVSPSNEDLEYAGSYVVGVAFVVAVWAVGFASCFAFCCWPLLGRDYVFGTMIMMLAMAAVSFHLVMFVVVFFFLCAIAFFVFPLSRVWKYVDARKRKSEDKNKVEVSRCSSPTCLKLGCGHCCSSPICLKLGCGYCCPKLGSGIWFGFSFFVHFFVHFFLQMLITMFEINLMRVSLMFFLQAFNLPSFFLLELPELVIELPEFGWLYKFVDFIMLSFQISMTAPPVRCTCSAMFFSLATFMLAASTTLVCIMADLVGLMACLSLMQSNVSPLPGLHLDPVVQIGSFYNRTALMTLQWFIVQGSRYSVEVINYGLKIFNVRKDVLTTSASLCAMDAPSDLLSATRLVGLGMFMVALFLCLTLQVFVGLLSCNPTLMGIIGKLLGEKGFDTMTPDKDRETCWWFAPQITFGIWAKAPRGSITGALIEKRKKIYSDATDMTDEKIEECVLRASAHLFSFLYMVFPGGVVLAKMCQYANEAPILKRDPNLRLDGEIDAKFVWALSWGRFLSYILLMAGLSVRPIMFLITVLVFLQTLAKKIRSCRFNTVEKSEKSDRVEVESENSDCVEVGRRCNTLLNNFVSVTPGPPERLE